MNYEIIEMILAFIATIFFMVFIGCLVAGSLAIICRPLGHQCEWEKKMQGERPINKAKRQGEVK